MFSCSQLGEIFPSLSLIHLPIKIKENSFVSITDSGWLIP